MKTKSYLILRLACIGALLLAGCNLAPETEQISYLDSEGDETSQAVMPSPFFTGPETARIGCSVTYSGMSNPGYTSKWEFGKMDAARKFTPLPDEILVITSNSTTYEIVILAAPGTYAIRRALSNGATQIQNGITKEVAVSDEGQARILQYVPWRLTGNGEINYSTGIAPGIKMTEECWVRTFSSKPSTANACCNYLIPVYKVDGLTQSTYQMNAPTDSSYTIPFYLFGSQRPGTVPIYLFKEYYQAPAGTYPFRIYTGNNYFSTTSTNPGVQTSPSGQAVYTENAGIAGYAFPAVPY